MNNLQWIKLKRDFEEARCILMIGPHLATSNSNQEEIPLIDGLAAYLADFLTQEKIDFDDKAKYNLPYIALRFLSIKGARRVDLEDLTKDFIQQNTKDIPETYNWLAKLPFNIIINTNPDDYMHRALLNQGKQPTQLYYNFRRDTEAKIDFEKINEDAPLIYNLFGSMEETESLVLTEEDQLDFVRNVVKDDPRIPEEILGQLDERKTYLFFGFNLERWQFRLLLDGLKLREENTTLSPQTDRFPLSSTTKTFYEERFSFQFVEKNIPDFLKELSSKVIAEGEDGRSEPKKVFLLYNEKDESFKDELSNAMSQLVNNEEVVLDYPQKFMAGTDDEEILEALKKADVVIPLLSPNFLADVELCETMLGHAAALDQNESVILRPMIARPCDWRENQWLRSKLPFPENGAAVTSNEWNTIDDAYFDIIQSFKKLLK